MGKTFNTGYLQNIIQYDGSNNIILPSLIGTGTRIVVAAANGTLSSQTASTTNIAEGTNLYYTDTRVGTYLSANTYATQSYVTTAIANLVDASPATLDTLNELAAALGDDPNFATTVATSIGTKQAQLNGTGFVKVSGTTVSYDNSTYLTTSSASNTYQTILTNPVTGTGTATRVAFFDGANTITSSSGFYWDNSAGRLAVGKNTADARLEVYAGTKGQIRANGGPALGGGIDIYTELSGTSRRNWGLYTEVQTPGDFSILMSSSAGTGPITEVFTIQNTGIGSYKYNLQAAAEFGVTDNKGIRLRGIDDSTHRLYYNTTRSGIVLEINNTFSIDYYNFGTPTTPYTFSTGGNFANSGNITASGSIQSGNNVGIRIAPSTAGDTYLKTGDAGITYQNVYFGTGQVRIGGGADHFSNIVLSVAPGGVHFDRPGVGGGALKITGEGKVYVNTTIALQSSEQFAVESSTNTAILAKFTAGGNQGWASKFWNNGTTEDNLIIEFLTESSITARGSVRYDRTNNALLLDGSNALNVRTNGNTFAYFSSNQRLGIGISPSQKLNVDGLRGQPAATGTSQNGLFRIGTLSGGYGEVMDMGVHVGVDGPASYSWIQSTNQGDLSVKYKLVLNPTGGTTEFGGTDGYTTAVRGQFFSKGGGSMFTANLLSGGWGRHFTMQRNDSTKFHIGVDGSDNFTVLNSSDNYLLQLASNGALGIGTSPSGTWTTRSVIQIGGFGTSLSGYNGGGGATELGHNIVVTNGFNYNYLITAGATKQYMDGANIIWSRAAIGTAGTAITFSQLANLNTTGLAIGGDGNPNLKLTVSETGTVISGGDVTFASQAKGIEIYNQSSGTTDNLIGCWFSTGPHKAGIASGRTNAASNWAVDLRFFVHGTEIANLDHTYEKMRLYGDGNLTINGSLTQSGSLSDITLKENLVKIATPLEKLLQISGYTFTWKENAPARQHISNIVEDAGLIAQEVESILPQIVRSNEDGSKALNYNGVVGLLVEAIKELTEKVNALENK